MNIKKVYKRDIALELISMGNEMVYTEPNHKKSWLVVFNFIETDKLLSNMTEIDKRNKLNK